MMPVEKLPAASWHTALGLGFVSAVFDNIPLTALALKQGGYDWGYLAYAVGFGGSMIWFGSSAGVALSNMYPEAKSVGSWVRQGWHVTLAYVVGFFVLLAVMGWHPNAPHKSGPRRGPARTPAMFHIGKSILRVQREAWRRIVRDNLGPATITTLDGFNLFTKGDHEESETKPGRVAAEIPDHCGGGDGRRNHGRSAVHSHRGGGDDDLEGPDLLACGSRPGYLQAVVRHDQGKNRRRARVQAVRSERDRWRLRAARWSEERRARGDELVHAVLGRQASGDCVPQSPT